MIWPDPVHRRFKRTAAGAKRGIGAEAAEQANRNDRSLGRLVAPFVGALAAARSALARYGVRPPCTLPEVAAMIAALGLLQLTRVRMSYMRDVGGSPAMLQEWSIIPGSPWLTRYCMEFATPDPLGCVAWYAEVHALSWSAALALVGLVFGVVGLMVWLRRLPTRPASKHLL